MSYTLFNVTPLIDLVIPNYIRKVKLSESRRTKYFELPHGLNTPFAKKYQVGLTTGAYQYRERIKNKRPCLFDTVTKEFVVANPRVAGTQKWEIINGQKLYNQGYHPFVRQKIVDEIHKFFMPFLQNLPIITTFPIFIEYIFHTTIDERADIDNYALPYYKCFQDCLELSGIIPKDSWQYVNGFSVTHKNCSEGTQFVRLIIKIYANNL